MNSYLITLHARERARQQQRQNVLNVFFQHELWQHDKIVDHGEKNKAERRRRRFKLQKRQRSISGKGCWKKKKKIDTKHFTKSIALGDCTDMGKVGEKKYTSPEFVKDSSDDDGGDILTPPPTPPGRTQEDEDMANVLLGLQNQPAGPSSRITRRGSTVYRRAASSASVRRSPRNQGGRGFLPTAAAILGGLSNYTDLIPANLNKILRIACRSRCTQLRRKKKKKKQSGGLFLPRSSPPFWNPQNRDGFY